MQCPECHAYSVVIKDGEKRCEAKGCTYLSFHVITYQNQIRQFEGEKGPQNRYSSSNPNGRDTKVQKNFQTASKGIHELASVIGFSADIVDKAEGKLIQMLKIKYAQKRRAREEQNETGQRSNEKRIKIPDYQIAAFALYLACYDKGMLFKDVRIANELGIKKKDWEIMAKDLRLQLQNHMTIPTPKLQNDVRRIAQKRRIDRVQINAMIQMVERIKQKLGVNGNRYSTIAACVFWQIMRRSSTYNNDEKKFDIKNYLKRSRKQTEDKDEEDYWTQKHFECSFEAVRQYRNEVLGHRILEFIPNFKTRISEDKVKAD